MLHKNSERADENDGVDAHPYRRKRFYRQLKIMRMTIHMIEIRNVPFGSTISGNCARRRSQIERNQKTKKKREPITELPRHPDKRPRTGTTSSTSFLVGVSRQLLCRHGRTLRCFRRKYRCCLEGHHPSTNERDAGRELRSQKTLRLHILK